MRFSAVAALCAAPLALAGTLQSDLAARGAVGIEQGLSVESSSEESHGGKDVSKSSSNGDNGNSGNVVLESSSITENHHLGQQWRWISNYDYPTTVHIRSAIKRRVQPRVNWSDLSRWRRSVTSYTYCCGWWICWPSV